MIVARVADVRGQGGIRGRGYCRGRVSGRIHRVQVAVCRRDRGGGAGIGGEVVDGCDGGCGGRGDGRLRGQFGTFVPTGGQEVSQLGFVPPVHSLRRGLAGEGRSHHRTGEAVAVRKVTVGEAGVQITDLEVHRSFAEEISALFLPASRRMRMRMRIVSRRLLYLYSIRKKRHSHEGTMSADYEVGFRVLVD